MATFALNLPFATTCLVMTIPPKRLCRPIHRPPAWLYIDEPLREIDTSPPHDA